MEQQNRTTQQLLDAVRRNLAWFQKSGVMDPPDGSWGVAERIAITQGNAAMETIFQKFPAWSEFGTYCVIEPRRPDCNFETALLVLLAAAEVTGEAAICEAYRKLLELLISIQDRSDNPAFRGCWRGMYDLHAGTWGGGDLFEGGQNSIYTGWTNAPIALGLLFAVDQTSLISL